MSKIYLFYGDEDFLIDEEIKHIKGKVEGLSLERISGSKKNTDNVVSSLTSLPMFFSQRLVVIDDIECEEKNEEKLFSALKGLDPSVTVIFVNYNGIDRRKRLFKRLVEVAEVREFKHYSEWDTDKVLSWLLQRVKLYGKKISGGAANLLMGTVGLNLRMLDKELEKIATYVGEKEMIEEQDVSVLASSGELDAFALSNALREKDVVGAMRVLERAFKDNESPQALIGMMAQLYRKLLQVKSLEKAGKSSYDIATMLHAKPYFVKETMARTNRFTLDELTVNIKSLHIADLQIKSGYDPKFVIEILIPELCGGR
jgi:DNA polymerase III subunit delta